MRYFSSFSKISNPYGIQGLKHKIFRKRIRFCRRLKISALTQCALIFVSRWLSQRTNSFPVGSAAYHKIRSALTDQTQNLVWHWLMCKSLFRIGFVWNKTSFAFTKSAEAKIHVKNKKGPKNCDFLFKKSEFRKNQSGLNLIGPKLTFHAKNCLTSYHKKTVSANASQHGYFWKSKLGLKWKKNRIMLTSL